MPFFTAPAPVVLVVDDEALLRLDATEALQQAGCRTYEAGETEEALEMLGLHPEISVLFTDINMPGRRDGLALAGEVHRQWPAIGVIITSGQERPSPSDIPAEGRFIAKPYDIGAVAELVKRLQPLK